MPPNAGQDAFNKMTNRSAMVLPLELTKETVAVLCRAEPFYPLRKQTARMLDISHVTRIDGAGVAFLWLLQRMGWSFSGLSELVAGQLKDYDAALAEANAERLPPPDRLDPISALGKGTYDLVLRGRAAAAYLGEVLWYLFRAVLAPHHFRWADFRIAFYRSGVQAVPVVMLMGFLLGLILAFQSAIPLKMFGGEGFVGGLVGIGLVRELGLIITAILVTGRSGSSFAAELGTMQVNEEIDALETMGLQPVRFLVLPRVVAGTLALPALALFATLAGLLGGWLVMSILGFSTTYYMNQLQSFVHLKDLIGSFCKSFIFGFVISCVGCWFGLHAGRDAGAVGTSTTTAVVVGIMLIAILEGIFSVVFYAMGW